VQKGYFGRQRLEAFTKGLRIQGRVGVGKASIINLAHARRDMQRTESFMRPATPQQQKSFTLKQRSSDSRMSQSAGSSRTRSSKVLAVLDTSERMLDGNLCWECSSNFFFCSYFYASGDEQDPRTPRFCWAYTEAIRTPQFPLCAIQTSVISIGRFRWNSEDEGMGSCGFMNHL